MPNLLSITFKCSNCIYQTQHRYNFNRHLRTYMHKAQDSLSQKPKKTITSQSNMQNKVYEYVISIKGYTGPRFKKAEKAFYKLWNIKPEKNTSYSVTFDSNTSFDVYKAFIDVQVAIVQDALADYKQNESHKNAFLKALDNLQTITDKLKSINGACLYGKAHFWRLKKEELDMYLTKNTHNQSKIRQVKKQITYVQKQEKQHIRQLPDEVRIHTFNDLFFKRPKKLLTQITKSNDNVPNAKRRKLNP